MGARFFHEFKYKSWSRVVIYSRARRKFSTDIYINLFSFVPFSISLEIHPADLVVIEIKGWD